MTFPEKTRQLRHLIQTDLYRYTGEISARAFLRSYLWLPGFNYTFWFRIRSMFHSKIVSLVLFRKKVVFGIDLGQASIGEGFYIAHHGTIVVNPQVVIGKNCNISQGVTIGKANTGPKAGVPVLGDFVYIGPGAKIFGNIRIGNNVAIGANSVVTTDVPDNGVVVGVPARVVSYDGSTGYINKVLEV
jgi:serine O-acetyltransferase